MADYRMPIGYDLDLLCEATTWFATHGNGPSQRNVQRFVRVGFVKAQRLLLLMDDYGVTDGFPLTRWSSRTCLVTREQLPAKLAEIREAASKENTDG